MQAVSIRFRESLIFSLLCLVFSFPCIEQSEKMKVTKKIATCLMCLQLMTHLVNHLGHFPMGLGAARLHTTVQEHHDLPEADDLKSDIFEAPNLQVCQHFQPSASLYCLRFKIQFYFWISYEKWYPWQYNFYCVKCTIIFRLEDDACFLKSDPWTMHSVVPYLWRKFGRLTFLKNNDISNLCHGSAWSRNLIPWQTDIFSRQSAQLQKRDLEWPKMRSHTVSMLQHLLTSVGNLQQAVCFLTFSSASWCHLHWVVWCSRKI